MPLLMGILNCILYAAILILLGAIVRWVAAILQWPIPWDIQRIFLLIVLILFAICIFSDLLGTPVVHPLWRYP